MDATLNSYLNAGVKAMDAGMYDTALDSLTDALNRARVLEHSPGEMLALGLLAPTLDKLGRRDEGLKAATKALALSQDHGDEAGRAHYQGLVAHLSSDGTADSEYGGDLTEDEINLAFERAGQALTLGQGKEAVAILTPLMAAADQSGLKEVEASAAGMLAQAYVMEGYNHKAWELATHAVVIAKSLGEAEALAHFQELANALAGKEDGKAGEILAENQLVARITEQCALAGAALDEDRADDAVSVLLEAAEEARAAGIRESEATVRGFLAQAYLMAGNRGDAQSQAKKAISIAEELGDKEAAKSFKDVLKMASGWVQSEGSD
jgi:tetratricopeptide (TPR) repeat protein